MLSQMQVDVKPRDDGEWDQLCMPVDTVSSDVCPRCGRIRRAVGCSRPLCDDCDAGEVATLEYLDDYETRADALR